MLKSGVTPRNGAQIAQWNQFNMISLYKAKKTVATIRFDYSELFAGLRRKMTESCPGVVR
jgi:hypothetical protein